MNLFNFITSLQVEPILLIYMFAISLSNPTEEGLLYQKICITHFEKAFCNNYFSDSANRVQKYNKVVVKKNSINDNITRYYMKRDEGGDSDYHLKEDRIQREASKWIMYTQMTMSIPSVVTTLMFGACSDSVSRKYPIMISLIGLFVSNSFYMIIAFDIERFPLTFFLIPNFIIGLVGASNTLFSSVFSYVSYSIGEDNRTLHIAFLESCIMIGGAIGLATSGVVIESLGFFAPFLIVFISVLLAMIYTLIKVKDIQPPLTAASKLALLNEKPKKSIVSNFCSCSYLKETIAVCFKARPGRANLVIILFTCCFMLSSFVTVGEASISYLYLRRSSISLTQTQYGYYKACRTLCLGISLLVVLPLLKRFFNVSDMFCIVIGTISRSTIDLIYTFAREKYQIFLIPIFGMFTGYIITTIRSFLSKMVEPSEEGKLFAVVSSLEMINLFLATPTFNLLYTWSLKNFTGLPFMISFIIHLFTIPLFICIMKSSNKSTTTITSSERIGLQVNNNISPIGLSERE